MIIAKVMKKEIAGDGVVLRDGIGEGVESEKVNIGALVAGAAAGEVDGEIADITGVDLQGQLSALVVSEEADGDVSGPAGDVEKAEGLIGAGAHRAGEVGPK